ncbi:calmodulin isoform X3 [Dendrobium catenatum]|uniref:calmodulin isoform X3 n=1 Tax=Dendrobium catenatum TaxID=906689 RepID=UPI00109FD931|nr:calmodulin isoform X3 [Dendrobium catenatum]
MDFLTEEEVSEFRDAFCLLDKEGDGGCITMEEMIAIMKSIGRSSPNIEFTDIINHTDFDFRGNFDLTELFNLTTEIVEEINKEDELKEVFKVFDRDQKGFISATEMRRLSK